MKILRLSFKNLNSLAGVWEVDFKHPAYESSGIFAITGPTGAGKTTVLDAICLALYGQTPRLGRITQSENEIMSRQSGECFAEVEFETAKGHFRCHWSQHRSRKQADGQLQSPRHEIVEAESGIILESKLRAVTEKVEDATGMDFERFTRSMLLAQGGFAAFLQARPDERAPILEQITGTAIYSRISIKVHERVSEERKRLTEMRAELDGIQLLSPPEVEALVAERTELSQLENTLIADARILMEAQSWREKMAALEGELLQLDQDRSALETRKAAAEPELEQLILAGRALKLGGDHAHILSVRSQHKTEQSEHMVASERLPQVQRDWQSAYDALEQADVGLARARAEQMHEAEQIRITRALDVTLFETYSQLQSITEDIEKTGRQSGDYLLAITECAQRLKDTVVELHTVTAFLDEHQADAVLAGDLTGIEQQLKNLKTVDARYRGTLEKLGTHTASIETATRNLAQAESLWQVALNSVTDAENRLIGISEARETLLNGRDLSLWRDDTEILVARHNKLGIIHETLARMKEGTDKLAGLQLRMNEYELKRLTLEQQEVLLAGESELREQISRQLQDTVMLLNRVRSLEDDRKQLEDGVPCPLCGSSDHPYATGNIPHVDEAQKELELALAESKKVREQLSLVKLELLAVTKDLQQSCQDQNELQGRQQHDQTFCAHTADELGLSVESGMAIDIDAWSEVVRNEAEVCREALVHKRNVISTVEQKEQEERNAQTALAELKADLAGQDKIRLTALLSQESALSERVRLERESEALHDDLDRVLAEVGMVAAAHGCMEFSPDMADKLLSDLTSRRDAYVERVKSKDRLEKKRAEIDAEGEKQRSLLAESEKLRQEKELVLRDRNSLRDSIVEQRLEQYGERNPDHEEKRLAEALRLSGERREAALQEQHRLQIERGELIGQIERLTLSCVQREEQLLLLEEALRLRLDETGFTDEAALLQASLPQERFDTLTQMADRLRTDEAALQARHLDRSEALSCELIKNLTDKPLELIREENASVTEQLSELQKGMGALDHRLQQHADLQQRHQARFETIAVQKVECDRWERLHFLIGSSDGKKFRNFAQGLTFELMVAHANRQLQKMSDRYILVRDRTEPLELNVIDNYQAGEIRSTKNLSGGESFIASLALSLGLSSMASHNVRVDSLFLDEGFGTLDEDALETALETLSGLQQDGKLIGIISHVPALKERIGTQIQVEAGSAGRSSLSGPGCRRVV